MTRGCDTRARVGGLLLVCALAPAAPAAEMDHGSPAPLTLDVTTLYNSNVTLAQDDADIAEDAAVEGSLTVSQQSPGLQGRSAGFAFTVRGKAFDEFEELGGLELELEGNYRLQTARGFGAPTYEFTISGTLIESLSEIRQGWQFELGAQATKRLTDRITGRGGVRYTQRTADRFEVFDLERGSVFVNADWLANRQSVLYATYIFASGEVVSTADPTLQIIDAAQAIEPDDAFGGIPANRFAYRLEADVHIVTLGYNRKLGPSTSIDLSIEGLAASAEGDNDYDRGIARASFLRRF